MTSSIEWFILSKSTIISRISFGVLQFLPPSTLLWRAHSGTRFHFSPRTGKFLLTVGAFFSSNVSPFLKILLLPRTGLGQSEEKHVRRITGCSVRPSRSLGSAPALSLLIVCHFLPILRPFFLIAKVPRGPSGERVSVSHLIGPCFPLQDHRAKSHWGRQSTSAGNRGFHLASSLVFRLPGRLRRLVHQ